MMAPPSRSQHPYYSQARMPRYHSEESLPSKCGNADGRHGQHGLYSSRIHSSADEISSINRSPSELSSSDESFSRTDFSRDEDGESPSPPSRPRSHAPWIYPSDIQIDPSSLEVSPKLPHMNFPNGSDDPLRDLRLPSVGPSPSTFSNDASVSREPTEDKEEHDDEDDDEDDDDDDDVNGDDGHDQATGLRARLNLPPGVTAAESCRSASPGDGMTDSYRGDSCGSFEFLNSKHNRRGSSTGRGGLSGGRDTEESDDDRLFFPTRNEEKEAILRQIQTLNDNLAGETTEESRESSAQPEGSTRPVAPNVLDEIQKSIKPPPLSSTPERTIPLVIAVADAARNPRIRGKPSRLRDLQQPVPMEENPQEPIGHPQRYTKVQFVFNLRVSFHFHFYFTLFIYYFFFFHFVQS